MVATTVAAPASPSAGRILVIDWLRGVAVLLMILAHSFDAWMDPTGRVGPGWFVVRHASGIPSRLFLFLVGVSSAIVFEREMVRGTPVERMRVATAQRGLLVLVLAYLFRLQEHVLAGFWGGWGQVFRVDILNCIGASLLVLALVGVPRGGRPAYLPSLLVAAVLVGLGAVIGPAQQPSWIPRPLGSYIGGQRPMSWFPLFPWGAWALVGLVVGHLWLRLGRNPANRARVFLITGALGALSLGTVLVIRAVDPQIIRYPSEVVQQMGPGSFFFRLGLIGVLACLGWLATRRPGPRDGVIQQLGRTSLFIYWIHVEICYGFATHPLHKRLSFSQAVAAYVLLCLAMYGLSLWKTRRSPALRAWINRRLARGGR